MNSKSLDDLYRMTAYVYGEQNAIRPVSATFAHFVEVCGMLTTLDRRKKKEGFDFIDGLCKALGWYFPLLAKLKVRSVQEIVYRKFPYACPYCRLTPHIDRLCKTVKGTASTVDHESLRRVYVSNLAKRPARLDQWQHMFQEIYPRSTSDTARSSLGLFEELGELAESVRVFERYPKYFAGEAADTFSYLMGIANEYALNLEREEGTTFNLHDEYLKRFPGLCLACGHRVCACPAIPKATVGRLAKELDIELSEHLFDSSVESGIAEGKKAAEAILREIGGIPRILERFPADRGDANSALILLLMTLANEIEGTNPELADRFHAAAIDIGSSVSEAGSRSSSGYFSKHGSLLNELRETWRRTHQSRPDIHPSLAGRSLAQELGRAFAKVRILVVYASPSDQDSLRVAGEIRAIRESVRLSERRNEIEIHDLPAVTIDDLRRKLMDQDFEIVHFAGHSNADSMVFETADGKSSYVELSALTDLFGRYGKVRCVVLNSCESLAQLTTSISAVTVGMVESIGDQSAVAFATGFYDAVAAGRDFDFAVEEGKTTSNLKGFGIPNVKILKRA